MKLLKTFFHILIVNAALFATQARANGSQDIEQTIAQVKDILFGGLHFSTSVKVKSDDSLAWVRTYVERMYEDEALMAELNFETEIDEVVTDEMIAGLPTPKVVEQMIEEAIEYFPMGSDYQLEDQLLADREALFVSLQFLASDPRVVLGIDGFNQNACAAPTIYLLVFIPETQTVHGIDLTPCTES